jgi:glycosyltransferase involved in cell wall biosynthesis
MHELAGRLARRGETVRVLTGTPRGLASRSIIDGVPVYYARTPRLPSWPEPGPGFAAVAFAGSLGARADVVHSLHYADAAGAARALAPVILKLTGTVLPDRTHGLDARLFQSAIERSAEVWVNSRWAQDQMAGYDVPLRVVPAGVDTTAFRPGTRSARPLVVCAAAGDEPRKRLSHLLDAWPAVLAAMPDAELVLAGRGHPAGLPAGVRSVGELAPEAMAALYAQAWVVVAPALYEALGLVTLEALACGTPVAGADSGATSELLRDPLTGALADPDSTDAMAEAIVRAAALSQDPATADRCRQVALHYDWDTVVPQVLAGYARVAR